MEKNRKVPIKNILYMFSYIWDKAEIIDFALKDNNDDFDSPNILAKLFIENIKDILKVGLYREYKSHTEEVKGIKGKIDFKESLNQLSFENAKAVCEYDNFDENNIINQIIKTTAYRLYKSNGIHEKYRRQLNNILLYFNNVKIIDITDKSFDIYFNRNNYYTYFTIMVCKLIKDCTMLSEDNGKYKFVNILDDDKKMELIFELFIYKFYDIELKGEYRVKSQQHLNWNLENGQQDILPLMRMDTVLYGKHVSKTIIIDTKYYPDFMKKSFYSEEDKKTLISGNLYQMNAYMNNINTDDELVGMLLYPMPYSENEISERYDIDIVSKGVAKKAKLQIQTINLSNEWRNIKEELLSIIK
jgi:5-methylcytosine-specific restriction enzyme subunit McrC